MCVTCAGGEGKRREEEEEEEEEEEVDRRPTIDRGTRSWAQSHPQSLDVAFATPEKHVEPSSGKDKKKIHFKIASPHPNRGVQRGCERGVVGERGVVFGVGVWHWFFDVVVMMGSLRLPGRRVWGGGMVLAVTQHARPPLDGGMG